MISARRHCRLLDPLVGREAEEENLAAHVVIETTRENDSLIFVVRQGEVPPSARVLICAFLAQHFLIIEIEVDALCGRPAGCFAEFYDA